MTNSNCLYVFFELFLNFMQNNFNLNRLKGDGNAESPINTDFLHIGQRLGKLRFNKSTTHVNEKLRELNYFMNNSLQIE